MPRLKLPEGLKPAALALAPVLLMVVAAAFRLTDLAARNLWTDEAWVALAALQPTAAEALAARQSTPPLFLLSLWAAARLFGGSEAVLRALPFLFGLGTVLLLWPLARGLAPRAAALLTLAAAACSPVLVYFSKELKQYSGNAFFAVLVLLLAERVRARQGRQGWLALAAAGLLGLGFSPPLVFTLPVAAVVLWLELPAWRGRTALLAAFWALAFAVYYLKSFPQEMSPELVAYWGQDFPDFSGPTAFLGWLGQAFWRYFGYFLGPWGPYFGPPLVLLGLAALTRGGQARVLVYFAGPLLLALGAAALHRYPFMAHYGGNRLVLFSAPVLYLVAAAGLAAAVSALRARHLAWLAFGMAALLAAALHPREILRENLHTTINREEIRPLVAELARQRRPGDRVYVYYHAISPFKYYHQGSLDGVCWGKSCVETDLQAAQAPAPARLWLIASHFPDLEYLRSFAAGLLGPQWQEAACLTRPGAVLFRFERPEVALVAKPAASPPEPPLSGPPAPPDDTAW